MESDQVNKNKTDNAISTTQEVMGQFYNAFRQETLYVDKHCQRTQEPDEFPKFDGNGVIYLEPGGIRIIP